MPNISQRSKNKNKNKKGKEVEANDDTKRSRKNQWTGCLFERGPESPNVRRKDGQQRQLLEVLEKAKRPITYEDWCERAKKNWHDEYDQNPSKVLQFYIRRYIDKEYIVIIEEKDEEAA